MLQHPAIDRSQIVLFGRSLGGAVAVELARNPVLASHIAAVVVENTFTSIPDVARILFDCRPIRAIPNWFYKNQFNTAAKVGQVSQPTLFLSGLQDELIPPSMMFLLYQVRKGSTLYGTLRAYEMVILMMRLLFFPPLRPQSRSLSTSTSSSTARTTSPGAARTTT